MKTGSIKPLLADYGRIAYARFDRDTCCIIAINNTGGWTDFRLYVRDAGAKEGEVYYRRMQTTQETHSADSERWGVVADGYLVFDLPPYSAAIVSNAEQ